MVYKIPILDGSGRLMDSNIPSRLTSTQMDARYPQRVLPPTVASTVGHFNSAQSVYNLKAKHLRRTRAKMAAAKAGQGLFTVAGVGHSMVAGTGTNALPGISDWPTFLVDMLESAGYPRSGEGFVAGYNNTPSEPRITYPSGKGGWGPFNSARTNLMKNSADSNPIVFTSRKSATTIDIYYWNGAGPITASIDGGAAVTITPDRTQTVGKYTVTGLADTAHAVTIARVPGYTGDQINVFVFGVNFRKGTGVNLFNVGIGGASANEIFAADLYATMQFAAQAAKADLIFIEIMHNNITGGMAVDVWKSRVQIGIDRAKAANADIVLLTDTPVQLNTDQTAFTGALYELADLNDLPLVDLREDMGGFILARDSGLISSDNVHPTSIGYAAQARTIFNALRL